MMTQNTGLKLLGLLFLLNGLDAAAYYDEKKDELCREPKIQEFNLPEYSASNTKEVQPEAEFSFVVSGWANPKKIKVMAKDKPLPFTVESNDSFHRIKGKIPAEYNGKFIRLNVRIPAVLECYSTQGWLIKVAEASASAAPVPAEPAAAPKAESAAPGSAPKVESAAPSAANNAVKPEAPSPSSSTPAQTGNQQSPAEPAKAPAAEEKSGQPN